MIAKIAPSLLSADFGNLEAEVAQFDPSITDYLHVDVMDGHFVPNITIGPFVVKAISKLTSIPLDVHLMISDPDKYIPDFIKAGAHVITVHGEATPHVHRSLQMIRQMGGKAGVALNPSTSLSTLDYILPDLDMILLMTVNPGFGGQKFIPEMLEKIRACRERIGNYPIELEVDGGIKLENIRELYDAGANVFVSGSGIFERPPYNTTIRAMKDALL